MKIISAGPERIDEIFVLAENFWHESNYNKGGLTLKPDHWKQTVSSHMGHPNTAALCAVIEDKIVGYVLIYYQTDFTEEKIGEMFQFYVSPEFRGSEVSRSLVKAAIDQYEAWDCKRAYCEASPGLANEKHLRFFRNLWGKFGYEQIGISMMKEF